MCEFSGKLVAWLDRELPFEEAMNVERHLRACIQCRSQLDAYERVSGAVEVYCDAAFASKRRRWLPRWVLASIGVAAAVAMLFLALPRARRRPSSLPALSAAMNQPTTLGTARPQTAEVNRSHRRQSVSSPRHPTLNHDVTWLPPQPTIQIAIPAEAIFPPGAVPEGVNFTVDLAIAADGSAQRLYLRP